MNSPISKAMNIILWILQVALAFVFVAHGWLFLSPPADLVEVMNESFAPWFRITLGALEILGAIGLILPGITRIMPQLTVWAALGLGTIVGLAAILHFTRGEISSALTTLVLCVLCSFVAYMRQKETPIIARQTVANLS